MKINMVTSNGTFSTYPNFKIINALYKAIASYFFVSHYFDKVKATLPP